MLINIFRLITNLTFLLAKKNFLLLIVLYPDYQKCKHLNTGNDGSNIDNDNVILVQIILIVFYSILFKLITVQIVSMIHIFYIE